MIKLKKYIITPFLLGSYIIFKNPINLFFHNMNKNFDIKKIFSIKN